MKPPQANDFQLKDAVEVARTGLPARRRLFLNSPNSWVGLPALMALGFLVGCATPFRAPSDLAQVKLIRVDSPTVIVEKIWLERKHGSLVVKGYVMLSLAATDTSLTHLEVTIYDAQGTALRKSVAYFEPRHLVRHGPRPVFGSYVVVLDPLPPQTARVEVAAHDRTN